MKISTTYYLEMGVYSPLKEQEDGTFEHDYIYADTFEEAAQKAKEFYISNPQSPFGEPLACHVMMLMNFDGDDGIDAGSFHDRVAYFDFESLRREGL